VAGFAVFASVSSVEILADGIDKGAGVEWLARETGIALSEMGGIGDGPGDLAFMRRVGCSAAPANAAETVRREAQYVSSLEDSRAVVDILTRWSRASQEGGD
jgi:hydroxymethylpyrimidine pyrophosphatase-like HAD family hydrolase